MEDLAEKRVYADRADATTLVVAAAPGLAAVSVANGRVGDAGIARRCSPRDVAVGRGSDGRYRLVVATDVDVLMAGEPDVDALEGSGFGEAVGATVDGGRPVAGAADGRIGVHVGGRWSTVGSLPAPARALDGDLVGTAEGLFRLVDGELRPAGLSGVNDVARSAGVPLAATASGLYELGNGWMDVLDGAVDLVAGAPDGRAHATTAEGFVERVDGRWQPVTLPVDAPVTAVAYGELTYALTGAGDLLVAEPDGWRRHPLGLDGVVAATVL